MRRADKKSYSSGMSEPREAKSPFLRTRASASLADNPLSSLSQPDRRL